jgi:hypothetical protein
MVQLAKANGIDPPNTIKVTRLVSQLDSLRDGGLAA